MNALKKIGMTLLVGLSLTGFAVAGDAEVNADIVQDIDITTVTLNSDDGTVDASIASLLAHDNSEVDADIESEISLRTVTATTDDGVARLKVGSINAGF